MAARYVTIGGRRVRVGSTLYKTWKAYEHALAVLLGKKKRPLSRKTQLPHLVQHPSPNQSIRGAAIDLVVVHDTEGPYASAVNWFANTASQVSAHVVLNEDGTEATQCVPWSKKAWACVDFNPRSLNLEMAGKASVGYSPAEIQAAAAIVAYWCKLYKIPVRDAIGGHQSGITFHQDLGVAGGGHHDPGWNATQKAAFILKVKAVSEKGLSPRTWGHS